MKNQNKIEIREESKKSRVSYLVLSAGVIF